MFTATTQPKERRCMPWLPEEMIHVNGQSLVYTISKLDGIVVRFPGGYSRTVEELRALGVRVTMPRLIRTMQTMPA